MTGKELAYKHLGILAPLSPLAILCGGLYLAEKMEGRDKLKPKPLPPVTWDNIGVTPDELNKIYQTSFTSELPPEKRVIVGLLLDKETNKWVPPGMLRDKYHHKFKHPYNGPHVDIVSGYNLPYPKTVELPSLV